MIYFNSDTQIEDIEELLNNYGSTYFFVTLLFIQQFKQKENETKFT